jgi:2-keto-4-pentenoate hydratase
MHQALSQDSIAAAAELLRCAQAAGTPCPPIRESHAGATIDDAYAIQLANTQWRERQGATVVGAKIGLTAKAVQKQLGVDQPDFGLLFNDMAVSDGDVIAWGRVLQPKVEAEVAFVMARTPDPARLTTGELIDSVAYALPAIEIVGSRIANWDISIVDTIADNASSGAFVLGTRPVPLDRVDLRLCGMALEKNGEGVSFGAGAACLGHPLHALGWLAAKMAAVDRPLQAGDIVLSGALGPMSAVGPGDDVEARIEGLGTVKVRFGRETVA